MGATSNICADICKKDDTIKKAGQTYPYLALFKRQKAITVVHDISFPLRTDGARIVDSFNRRVKICAYNLKGCHSLKSCVKMLENRTVHELGNEIKDNGFNTVVIPFSLDFYFENPKVQAGCLGPNDWMKGKKALDVLDIIINGLTRAGLLVILRNVCSKARGTSGSSLQQNSNLWWSDQYPESKWIDCLRSMTTRYIHNPRVVAIQIRHSISGAAWGNGDVLTDWKRAATFVGNEILDLNPNINIIIPSYIRGDLRGMAESPIQLKLSNKLIYSTKIKQFEPRLGTNADFKSYFEQQLNCIRKQGFPLLVSGFNDSAEDKWRHVIDILEETDIDWVFSPYPLNRRPEHGLYTNPRIVNSLKKVQISTSQTQQVSPDIISQQNNKVYSMSLHPAPIPKSKQQQKEQILPQQVN